MLPVFPWTSTTAATVKHISFASAQPVAPLHCRNQLLTAGQPQLTTDYSLLLRDTTTAADFQKHPTHTQYPRHQHACVYYGLHPARCSHQWRRGTAADRQLHYRRKFFVPFLFNKRGSQEHVLILWLQTLGNASAITDNPAGAAYIATLPEEAFDKNAHPNGGNIKGSVQAVSMPNGEGVMFHVSFSNLPSTGGPFRQYINESIAQLHPI